jgi:protein-tyrosine phosphatase
LTSFFNGADNPVLMGAEVVQIFDVGDYDEQIHRAAEILKTGGIVVLPTETVYGAAVVLNHPKGLLRLRDLPPEAAAKPLTIHLARRDDARRYLGPANDLAQRMMKKLWPGPVAMMFDVPEERREEVAQEVGVPVTELYEGQSITLRCPDHVVATDVLGEAGRPVVLRKSGDASARVAEEWLSKIELILDAGPTRYSKPSTILKVKEDGYEIVRTGIYDQRIIERLLRTTILFVCSGNTCRSPMAEAITRQMLAKKLGVSEADLEKKGVSVMSAGSFAMPGAKAAAPAIEALKPMGADLSRHRSRPLSVELIHQADVIYTMGRSHAQAVIALVPSAAEKVVMLDPDREIDDPIGGDLSLYQSLVGQLQTLIEHRLEERSLP